MNALSCCGLHEAGEDAVGFKSGLRSRSEAYLAEDHEVPQRLFRMIVCGWYAGTPKEGKEEFLLGSCEIASEGLGGFETKCLFADGVQFLDEAFFDLGRPLPGDIAGFEFLPRCAES